MTDGCEGVICAGEGAHYLSRAPASRQRSMATRLNL
jgi:hypothetical protein